MGDLNADNSVSFVSNRFNEGSNERYWRRIPDSINSMSLLKLFIHRKITLFAGQNLDQICRLLKKLLDQLPIGQINSYLTVSKKGP